MNAVRLFAAMILGLSTASVALAQAYPNKPIRMIVPFPAGGGTDFVARTVGQALSGSLGQQVVVENRAGASGMIGVEAAARSAPDGYTLLIAGVGELTINPSLYRKVPYDTLRDLTPVTNIAINPMVLVVNPAVLPVNTQAELIANAKANPGKLNFASFGPGSIAHVIGEQFARRAGIRIVHVPYKGAAPALQDLVAGQVPMMFLDFATARTQVAAGKIRGLAVSTRARHPALPDIPTVAEGGLEGFDSFSWIGSMVPAGTPREIVARLSTEIATAVDSADLRKSFASHGVLPATNGPEKHAVFVREELDKWGGIIRALGLTLD